MIAPDDDFLAEFEAAPAVEPPPPWSESPRGRRAPRLTVLGLVGECPNCHLVEDDEGRAMQLIEMLFEGRIRAVCAHCRNRELRKTAGTCAAPGCTTAGGYFFQDGRRHCPTCLVLMPSTCHSHYPFQIPAERLHRCPAPTGKEKETPCTQTSASSA